MIFVFPIPEFMRHKLLHMKRLYAYPVIPESEMKENIFILDSGAFALSQKNKKMDDHYLFNLNQYYIANRSNNTICAAPDEFLNPFASMSNYEKWIKSKYCDITPVLQLKRKKRIDFEIIKYQLDFYLERNTSLNTILFSNPGMRALELPPNIFDFIKDYSGVDYIHNLGAGWDRHDVILYKKFKSLNSIDSIAYYNYVSKADAYKNAIMFYNLMN